MHSKHKKETSALGELVKILGYYKTAVLSILVALTSAAVIYSYFAPDVYQSETTIKIYADHDATPKDFMSMALGLDTNNVNHEIDILRSRSLIAIALENLNIGTRYFETRRLKNDELYKNSPFVVTYDRLNDTLYGKPFILEPFDKNRFRLIIKPSPLDWLKDLVRRFVLADRSAPRPIRYNQVHTYGEPIVASWGSLTIQKVYQLDNQRYTFTVTPNDNMYKFVSKSLFVSALSKQSIIVSVRFNDTVALRAKEVANAIANAYLEENLRLKNESANQTLYFLDMQLKAINKTLQSSAESLQKYKASNIVIDVSDKAQLTAEKLSELESELYELNMQLGILENILSYMKTHKDISGIDLGLHSNIGGTIEPLIMKIQETTTRYNSLLVEFTELHPDVRKVSEELVTLRNTLKQTIQSSIQSLKKRKATLNGAIAEHKKAMSAFPEQERELSQLTRNFMVNEKIYSFLLQKRAETAIVASSNVSETRIVDTALVPEEPIKPNRLLIVTLGLLLGAIVGTLYALIRNLLDDTIKTIEELEALSDIPIYGSIPMLDHDRTIESFHEALRVVRTNLDFIRVDKPSRLITVTSTIPAEGKTTLAVELSKIIAQSGKRVLLIDLDLRRSSVHKRLGFENERGMSTLLSGRHTIDEVLHHSEQRGLSVITAGPPPPNPSELLMSKEFRFILENLMHRYDYIVLDSPPVQVVTDGTMLLKMSDMNLFVSRANYTQKASVEHINDLVEKYGLKNSGIVFNGVTMSRRLKYGYEYGYYHHDSKRKTG